MLTVLLQLLLASCLHLGAFGSEPAGVGVIARPFNTELCNPTAPRGPTDSGLGCDERCIAFGGLDMAKRSA